MLGHISWNSRSKFERSKKNPHNLVLAVLAPGSIWRWTLGDGDITVMTVVAIDPEKGEVLVLEVDYEGSYEVFYISITHIANELQMSYLVRIDEDAQ